MASNLDLMTLYHVVESINRQIEHQYKVISEMTDDTPVARRSQERGELYGLRVAASRVVGLILDAGGKEPKVE